MLKVWVYLVIGAMVWITASILLSIFLPGATNGSDSQEDLMPAQVVMGINTVRMQQKVLVSPPKEEDKPPKEEDNIEDNHAHQHKKDLKHSEMMAEHLARNEDYIEIFQDHSCTGTPIKIMTDNFESLCDNCWDSCGILWPSKGDGNELGSSVNLNIVSILIMTDYKMRFYETCKGTWTYKDPAAVTDVKTWPKGSCLDFGLVPPFSHVEFIGVEKNKAVDVVSKDKMSPSYNVAFSAESSYYFAYQAMANLYAFETTNQSANAVLTRLLTCSEPDDFMKIIPTFQRKRDPASLRYSPFNKPDIIAKWFSSDKAPTEEVIVVIDPDNWLVKDLSPIVRQVREGHAFGSHAFYQNNPQLNKLWQRYCKVNCDHKPDAVAVPYFVHRNDLAKIAPLWREYTRLIREDIEKDPSLIKEYSSIQMSWCAEMFAYNFAAAHVGVQHTGKGYLQLRDVDRRRRASENDKILMIHMGRAWFPHDYEPGKKWSHTEGKAWKSFGNQVWCKCNYTAGTVVPWPLPDNLDFVSRVTLTKLHYALEKYPIPTSSNYFKQPVNAHSYHHSYH